MMNFGWNSMRAPTIALESPYKEKLVMISN